jgi:ATP-binding cassette, subfamily B, multidrug efflux pump
MSQGFDDDEILGKAYDGRLVRRLGVFVVPYRRQLLLSLGLLLVATLLELAPPLLVRRAIDGPITAGNPGGLWPLFGLYLAALSGVFVLRYVQLALMQAIGQQVMVDLRVTIFAHIQSMSMAFFDRNPVGRLITRITNDVDALNEFLTQGLVSIIADSVLLIGIVAAMFWLNWRLALVSLAVLPIMVLANVYFRRLMRVAYRTMRQRLARINAYLNEQIGGVLTTQLYGREARSRALFDELSRSYLAAQVASQRAFALFFPTITVLSAIAVALLLSAGGYGVGLGWASIGTLVAFIQLTERAFQPIRDLAEKYSILQAAMASAERVFGVLDTPVEVADPAVPQALGAVRGEVAFEGVSFAYVPGEPVLRDVSFRIPAGQSVAVVGATGAGKTSLISLLARFYDPQEGRITLDGVNIKSVRQAELRRHIGAVPQDPVCFGGTIASNIRLHDESISDEAVRRAAELANAAPFIARLPGGYNYEVRERGSNLSQGQRQLLAFARAIAFNPAVLLILDEATSSVDTATEALIQAGLERLLHNRTSIVIAHRLSTIRHVDRIIVLHRGRIVEDGTHDELLQRGGYYHRLYQLQFAEQERQER